ncbi:MAG: transglycosylase SLT domain-containing protein [Candidatus Acidiferrales bacterium]
MPRLACVVVAAAVVCCAAFARPLAHRSAAARLVAAKTAPARTAAHSGARPSSVETQLQHWARALKEKNPQAAYAQLSALADRKSSGVFGLRAALALGYYHYSKADYPKASAWLTRAQADPLLRDYSLYWLAETNIALNRNAEALDELQQLRQQFPDSVITEQALQSLGTAAIALNQPAAAISALDAYTLTPEKPALLFMRGEAREEAAQPLQGAADYQTIYLRYPLSEQARQATEKLSFLRSTLGAQLPAIPFDQQVAHAAALFAGKQWGDARIEYSQLLPQSSGAERERAELRVLECGLALGENPADVAALAISNPDVEAERSYTLTQWYREQQQEQPMVAAAEATASHAPSSAWTEAALFATGNYFWVQLDRDRASAYYRRVADGFSSSPDATPAQWRVAWTAVLQRAPDASELLTEHLRRFPGSIFTPDALYWLGRLAEESHNDSLARAYYAKLGERYPQNYFSNLGLAHLHALGPGETAMPEVLATVPPLPPAQILGSVIPPAAAERQARADALSSIAFDSSAVLELRAAYAATGEPRLLLEAAQASVDAGKCGAATMMARQIYPQLEWRAFGTVPPEVWKAAFAMPFSESIRRWSAHSGTDPMLTAGLIRQESAFDPEARSGPGALGLMQLLPKTARRMAPKAHVRYSHAQLFDPDYNIRLGTVYLAGLEADFGGVEPALAAYNAGEDRVALWTAGQNYREPAEFVDSIPFTETREYVEIVTRNAAIFRMIYEAGNESRKAASRHKH